MTVVITVADLLAAFRPVAEQMLRPEEFRGAEFWTYTDRTERLRRVVETEVVDEGMVIGWSVAGDEGDSWLWLREGEQEMLVKIADDFQDFIAESSFAWGELRPIPPIPPIPPERCPSARRDATGAIRPRRGPSAGTRPGRRRSSRRRRRTR